MLILLLICGIKGDRLGLDLEAAFFAKAKATGMTDEEAKSAFNSNMMATGLLSERPAEFARDHGRRWLVSAYEAGDVVLHKPHMVKKPFSSSISFFLFLMLTIIQQDSCLDCQQ